MMGRLTGDQAKLFYEFCLDDRVFDVSTNETH